MKFQLIRNATIRIEYAGINILIDPMLGSKHSFGSFGGIEDNPTVDLPISASEVLEDLDLILISHLHEDHFDAKAQEIVDKALPILCQPGDRGKISTYGFTDVVELESETQWRDVNISRTGGQHGRGQWAKRLNPVSGFVFQSPGEPTVYWIGDSVWCEEVKLALEKYQPDVIVTHSGGAELGDSGPIIMDAAQTSAVCEMLPSAVVIATHMEALDHCKTSRKTLRTTAKETGIDLNRLLIPEDGELVEIN
jgi:L-ascorbate metabolism protein UlaG (beta-lactamase superfamily)